MSQNHLFCENGITSKMRQVRQPSLPAKTAEKITVEAYKEAIRPSPPLESLKKLDLSKLKTNSK